MESCSIFLGWKNQYCENFYITKWNLQIQCNHYEITNSIFQWTRTKYFTICMETQKTLNSQSNLVKEEYGQMYQPKPSWLQTIPQSYSHQDNMLLAQKQKYKPMEQDTRPRDKPTHLLASYFWHGARIYNVEKTVSSISGAGKTG